MGVQMSTVSQSIPPYKPRGPRSIHAGRGLITESAGWGCIHAAILLPPAPVLCYGHPHHRAAVVAQRPTQEEG